VSRPRLMRKDWDSDFFGREVFSLEDPERTGLAHLAVELASLDSAGTWATECHLVSADFAIAPTLEELGFRLVDSKMTFLSVRAHGDTPHVEVPYGLIRTATEGDLSAIDDMTTRHLVDNPDFHSRFKDRRLYSRDESIRYYAAWNQLVLDRQPELFAVWDSGAGVVAYFNYLRDGIRDDLPVFKGVLTAVEKEHRGHQAHNALQSFLFEQFGVDRFVLNNTTQVTNLAVVTNHIRARKQLHEAIFTFYRLNPRESVWADDSGRSLSDG